MKLTLHFISFCLVMLVTAAKATGQDFGNTIYLQGNMPAAVQEAVKDMSYWLQKSTGKEYAIRSAAGTENKEGIQLIWADKSSTISKAVQAQLTKDGQSFYLCLKDNSSAQIIGTGDDSFVNGIYTFLQELGFRWYMPGDAWTIVPASLKTKNGVCKVYTPDFRGRFYAGTGGVNAIPETDPQNTFKKDYAIWNRRNRFGSDYASKGHSGHLFYNANKKIFDQNPSWFCNGKINRYGRMDFSNTEVVQLFVQWALSQVKPGEKFPTIGVDPADGAGGKDDCLPKDKNGIQSWSDKYFWLANQVAKNLDKNDHKAQVQLYAYSNHSAPPSFDLEENVYPVIIPYAFQNLTSPREFIRLWSKKMDGRAMGIYDYWNITQWSKGLPQFNIYSIPEKLRYWKQYNITSITLETTNGKGAMGHSLWLASQMMWNARLSFDSLYQDFLQQCFGPAAPDIKRMYDRWSRNYQEAMEVNLSLDDLARASSKTKDHAINERLDELKAYVHFMKLFYDYQANSKSLASLEKLRNYIHVIHGMRLVQSSALLERYIKAPKTAGKAIASRRSMTPAPLNIGQLFRDDLKVHAETYRISDFTFDITKAKPLLSEKQVSPQYINGRNEYRFYLPAAAKFELKAGSNKDTKLIIADENKNWIEKTIPASKGEFNTVNVQLPAGTYSLSFGDFARFSRIIFPKDKVFIASGISYYDNAGYPVHYFYVPPDADAIVYQDELGPGVNKKGYWMNPDGQKVEAKKLSGSVYKVDVPPRLRGKVWALYIGHRSFRMLNIPNVFSIRKFEYKED